jgi:hypothetical protein
MLPIEPALVHASPSGVFGWGVWFAVWTLPFGSALRWVSSPVSLFSRALRPRLVSSTTMASADSCPDCSQQVSPGKSVMLPCSTTAFTSTGKPDDFAVLCQLVVPCRPSMRFLSIGSQVSPSLPSPSRSPFPSWLQMVVSSFSCLVFLQGTCTPFTSRPCWAHTRRPCRPATTPQHQPQRPAMTRRQDIGVLHIESKKSQR